VTTDTTTLAEQLQNVLRDVWRLRPDWQNPEAFHEGKSEIVGRLKALLAQAGAPGAAAPVKLTRRVQRVLSKLETPSAAPPVPGLIPPVTELLLPADPVAPEPPPPPPTQESGPPPAPAVPAAEAADLGAGDLLEQGERVARGEPDHDHDPPTPVIAPEPPVVSDLHELRDVVGRLTPVLTGLVSDIEKLAMVARSAVAAHALALTLPTPVHVHMPAPAPAPVQPMPAPVPAPAPTPTPAPVQHTPTLAPAPVRLSLSVQSSLPPQPQPPPPPSPPPLPRLAPGRYPARDLRTDGGQAIAARLWVAGHAQLAINRHFSATQQAAASMAIAAFIRRRLGRIGDGDRKALAAQALRAPPVPVPLPLLPLTAPLPQLAPGRFSPADLRTNSGQVIAAKLWVDGHLQKAIGSHFGVAHSAPVSVAIAQFVGRRCGRAALRQYYGAERKELAERALRMGP
jgi:hypothetical protein